MRLTQYYLDCLSQASYLIGDETTGKAVVVDPRRDIDQYLEDAAAAELTIVAVIETHFHADFLSGHLEVADATGAEIIYSSVAETEFDHRGVGDGERMSLGEVTLEFRHTPGHTPESMSIVVYATADDLASANPHAVLTGDTLFIGDVGRPDLLSSVGVTREELAASLYDSLHSKLLTLPDDTKVFPAHGAGSACGKNLSSDTQSTIGEQRSTNYALQAADREAFIDLVTEGQPPAPSYFAHDAALNRQQRPLLEEDQRPEALSLVEVDEYVAAGAVLLDGRDPEVFARGHLRGAINIGLNGRYAEFAGSIIPADVDIVITVDNDDALEAKNRLARIGFDRVVGYLPNPAAVVADHPDRAQRASRLTAARFGDIAAAQHDLQIIDVRNPGEVADGTLDQATNIPVGQLPERLDEIDHDRPTVVFCAGGYRSSVAASVLRAHGVADVSDILGGYGALTTAA